jgi:hypothetical protein
MILDDMKKTDCVWLGRVLLPALWCLLPMKAHAQLGLGATGAAATAQWVVLALILLVLIVVVGVLLYVVARWLRPRQPRLRFVRALAYGALVMVFLILLVLCLNFFAELVLGSVVGLVLGVLLYVVVPRFKPHRPRLRFVRALAYGVVIGVIMTYVLSGAWSHWQMQNLESQLSPCAEQPLSPPQFLLVTALEDKGPCQSRPCVKRAFGKPMSGTEYVVKNAVGEALFVGKIDQDGNAIWFGDALGQKVGIELYWQDLCIR